MRALEGVLGRPRRAAGAILLGCVIVLGAAACSSPAPEVEASIPELEDALVRDVVPMLAEDGCGGLEIWERFDTAVRRIRTEQIFAVRGADAGCEGGSRRPHVLSAVVTLISDDDGACVATRVEASGEVTATPVAGHPAANCARAQVPFE